MGPATESTKISVEQPVALVLGLYIRDAAGLRPATFPAIPPLDPPFDRWPVWARRPAEVNPYADARRIEPPVDPGRAAEQWARWWNHAVDAGITALEDFKPPHFEAFRSVPDLRTLVRQHFHVAMRWSDAFDDDPRAQRDLSKHRRGLDRLVREFDAQHGSRTPPFAMRITVVPVESKHGWVIGPDHLLVTRRLMNDIDNMLDWVRLRLRARALPAESALG